METKSGSRICQVNGKQIDVVNGENKWNPKMMAIFVL